MRILRAAAMAILVAASFGALIGCGSGGDGGPPPPPPGTIRLEGRVLAADDPGLLFPGATVTVLPAGITVTADAEGRFAFSGLDSVPLTVEVNPAFHPGYQASSITLPALTANYLNLNLALLPRAAGTVTGLTLGPQDQQVEIGGQLAFLAQVVTSGGVAGLRPTWLVLGGVGPINAGGLFTATTIGAGRVLAFSGRRSAQTTVEVVGERPPVVLDMLADPALLPPDGGALTVIASLADADGIAAATAEIITPEGALLLQPMARVAGGVRNGTWRVQYLAPPNTNVPNAAGVQAPMVYSVRVRVVDGDGAVTLSSPVSFTVSPVVAPPPPPL